MGVCVWFILHLWFFFVAYSWCICSVLVVEVWRTCGVLAVYCGVGMLYVWVIIVYLWSVVEFFCRACVLLVALCVVCVALFF